MYCQAYIANYLVLLLSLILFSMANLVALSVVGSFDSVILCLNLVTMINMGCQCILIIWRLSFLTDPAEVNISVASEDPCDIFAYLATTGNLACSSMF